MNARFTIRPLFSSAHPRLLALFAAMAIFAPAGLAQERVIPQRSPQIHARQAPQAAQAPTKGARISEEKSGSFTVRDGQRLRLSSDVGNIRVRTRNSGQVSYRVRIEADAREPEAQQYLSKFVLTARAVPDGVSINARVPWHELRGHLWVTFDVNVPRNFQLELNTQSGNIATESTNGRITLETGGGNLTVASVGGPARLETRGGHITVQDVAADLSAISAGGHITVGNVQGDAVIRTGGGHIRVASVQGTAQLETGGGNISLGRAGAGIIAHTGGGRIDLGEASGTIRASTDGGNIDVLNVAGSTQLDSAGGSICLTKVQGAIRASTATGTITAWFIPEGKLLGPSQLESGAGDILVFIPRELAISIDATAESPAGESLSEHPFRRMARIDADPAIPLKVTTTGSAAAGRTVRGEAVLNGGGEVLRLKTVTGNIRLRFSGSPRSADESGVSNLNFEPDRELLRRQIEVRLQRSMEEIESQFEVQKQVQELDKQIKVAVNNAVPVRQAQGEREVSRLAELQRKILSLWSRRLRVDAAEQKQRLIRSVSPAYPLLATQQRIEGLVRLEVYVSSDGAVEDVKVLSGNEILARAAVDAVRQWRYAPLTVEGKPIPVVTNMDVDFRLN